MVKCADCGFLTLRNAYSGQLDEVDEVFRDTGDPPRRRREEPPGLHNPTALYTTPYHHVPICFAGVYDFLDEMKLGPGWRDHDLPGVMVKEVIEKDRECPLEDQGLGFTPWQRGFTPKEHRDICDRQQALIQESEIRNLIWQREDARDKRAEDWHKEEMNTLRSQHRQQLIVFGLFVGILSLTGAVIGGILDGLVSRGVDVLPF